MSLLRTVGKLLTPLLILAGAPAYAGLITSTQAEAHSTTLDALPYGSWMQTDRSYMLPAHSVYLPAYRVHFNDQGVMSLQDESFLRSIGRDQRSVFYDLDYERLHMADNRRLVSSLEGLFADLARRFPHDYATRFRDVVSSHPVSVPEPSAVVLMLIGLLAMVSYRRKPGAVALKS